MEQDEGPGERITPIGCSTSLISSQSPSCRPGVPTGRGRTGVLVGIVALLVVGVAVAAAVVFGGGDETDEASSVTSRATASPVVTTAAPTTEAPVAAAPSTVPETTAAPTTVVGTTVVETTTVAEASTTVAAEATATVAADPAAGPVRWAEYSGGVVYLRGRVPDQATADEVAVRAGAVVGPENVRVEYTIDPTAPRPDTAPLYVNDSILFDPGMAELNASAVATLDLGVSLLTLFPQVTFDIEGHTDSQGTEASNLALLQRRVDVIVAYLTERGIDPTRLTAVAKGESEPIADNATPEGRARNRRIEIQVNNFLA